MVLDPNDPSMAGYQDPNAPQKKLAVVPGSSGNPALPDPYAPQPQANPGSLLMPGLMPPPGLPPTVSAQPMVPQPQGAGATGAGPMIAPMAPQPLGPLNPPAAAAGGVPGTSSFGPGNNLIGTQINPTPSGDTIAARTQLGTQLGGLQGPDRKALALDALKTFDQNQADTEKLGVQDIGREAAAAGRLGSGMVSTSLGDLQTQLAQKRDQEVRGLASDVAGKTLDDRLAALGGTESGLGQLSGLDTGAADALRGERGYQTGLDQTATDNAVRQFGLEEGAQGQDFAQKNAIDQQLEALGFGGNTANFETGLADTYAGNATDLATGGGNVVQGAFQNPGGSAPAPGSTLLDSLMGDFSGEGAIDPNMSTPWGTADQIAALKKGVDPYAALRLPQLAGV